MIPVLRRTLSAQTWAAIGLMLVALAPMASPASGQDRKANKAKKARAENEEKAGKDGEAKDETKWKSTTFSGLKFREIGPAMASGRVSDLAVHPDQPKTVYAAIASGGIWKTTNAGTTWKPIFDGQASFSVGTITLDPSSPLTVWAGTGENNSQRSVSYGDGVYRSVDGGRSWKNMGLKESMHIGMVRVDPRDSNTVFVAAMGPLWSSGGERGLYKTTNGGETWDLVLEIDEDTGVSEVHLDPRDPDVLYAVAYQRARRQWTLINGGTGSGVHKSTDGGVTWRKLTGGLPGGEVGRIGLAVSPAKPDTIYAVVEASSERRGLYRSEDAGANWTKRSPYVSGSPQYYQELVADPVDPNRVYSLDTFLMVSEDGGANFNMAGEENKHVDNHALWIDPSDTDHLLVGCDGGIYESWDRASTWKYTSNLPITQFYKIAVDDEEPFYNVYGGTQDNNTLGGPTQTHFSHGISDRDWIVTVGGDGFQPEIEPGNPDVVYSQSQYGNLSRIDRKSGEVTPITPQENATDAPFRWHWDSPLIVSPHQRTRIYYASQFVFRSDDRGNSWERISDDLTQNLDRNQLKVRGKLWGIDSIAKNTSTSPYGSVVSLYESPRIEGLLYAGSDDGLLYVLSPSSGTWQRMSEVPNFPKDNYVADLVASQHSDDRVFAVFNNHKAGDLLPYVAVSEDRGQTWTNITSDLPERGSTWTLIEDHQDENLLFAGTEFGVFFSTDRGKAWVRLKSGVPPIPVRDLAIQRREDDLVLGTFGRGFIVLDDYSPLRNLTPEVLEEEAKLFPVPEASIYTLSSPLTGSLGHTFYTAPNPDFGAAFTYYLKDGLESLRQARRKQEKDAGKAGENVTIPSWDELRAEEAEQAPKIEFVITDSGGNVVRRLDGKAGKGLQRSTWDLRYPSTSPISGGGGQRRFGRRGPTGNLVPPGNYTVTMYKVERGERTQLADPQSFSAKLLHLGAMERPDSVTLAAFREKVADLGRAASAAQRVAQDSRQRLGFLKQALSRTRADVSAELSTADDLLVQLAQIELRLNGDRLVRRYQQPTSPSLMNRIQRLQFGMFRTNSGPTGTQERVFALAAEGFAPLSAELRELVENRLPELEGRAEELGAPWTPGRRLPNWQP